MMILEFITLAFTVGTSSTYGYGEHNCGDVGKAVPCARGAITASGEVFDPEQPTAALAAPFFIRMRPIDVWMQVDDGPCVLIRLTDKMNERYVGVRGFDLTPKAVELLTGNRSPTWSGRVTQCTGDLDETFITSGDVAFR